MMLMTARALVMPIKKKREEISWERAPQHALKVYRQPVSL
jgi:hypothetical protein